MTDQSKGLLAIWSTIAADVETDYLHWLTREHIFERVSVPGFLSGRVFKRRDSQPSQYFMLYELAEASVMSSPAYLARLNDPTPWTQRIMPRLMQFRRGGGSVDISGGHVGAHGSHLAIARFDGALPDALTGSKGRQLVEALAELDWVVNVQMMTVQTDATAIATREKSMRSSQEGEFSGLLIIQALDHAALERAVSRAKELLMADNAFEIYELSFSCHASQQ
ncbi:hypothetical protein M1M11_10790 [Pseudomonas azerbaijanoccidens]|uniref:DUF4286 family protein n=1 Tax=Pseudomonas azerbaijanoccidentalis TaxID=2842347 RepID=UPI00200A943C|nr:DUF4286 family protein [Pseudomonas azerbaijanoccidentalis]MCK8665369.1 hypothetical protein [Pseudomonas azerbaijanoccidentalis]